MSMREGVFKGRHLDVSGVHFRRMTILPDPSLKDEAALRVTFDDDREFEDLTVTEGDKINIKGKHTAGGTIVTGDATFSVGGTIFVSGDLVGGMSPESARKVTLDIEIRVPLGFTLRLDLSTGRTRIGDVAGVLHVDVAGSAFVEAGKVRTLDVDVSGSGRVEAQRVVDGIAIDISGSGKVSVGTVEAGELKVGISGSGGVEVLAGTLDSLKARISGAGRIKVDAHVEGDADVSASGAARVSIATVAGQVRERAAGAASVSIGTQRGFQPR